MDINNLINYLKNDDDIDFSINKLNFNETENINKLNKFNDIFNDYVIRYGIISHYKKKNISFLFCILFILYY